MSIKDHWKPLLFPAIQYHTPKIQKKWRTALLCGDFAMVRKLIATEDLSPSMATTPDGEHPLKTLAQADAYPEFHQHQAVIAYALIAQGCAITEPDKYFMLPADYAMLSGNRELALTVVKETIERFHDNYSFALRQNPDQEPRLYVPDTAPFFATCLDGPTRLRTYTNYVRNKNYLAEKLFSDTDLPTTMLEDEWDYWKSKPSLLCDMPYPSLDFARALNNYSKLIKSTEFNLHADPAIHEEMAYSYLNAARIDAVRHLRVARLYEPASNPSSP